jgi:uncharacterized protein
VHAALGSSPWTVLAQGASRQLEIGIGPMTVAISFAVLIAWIPLRQQPGLGTLLNAVLVGVALGVTLNHMPDLHGEPARLGFVALGIALVAVGSGLYLTSRLGPGPRDGLMTGLHRRTGRSLGMVRTVLEASVVLVGFLLGGTVGVGTLAFALIIGPGVQLAVRLAGGLHAARRT